MRKFNSAEPIKSQQEYTNTKAHRYVTATQTKWKHNNVKVYVSTDSTSNYIFSGFNKILPENKSLQIVTN